MGQIMKAVLAEFKQTFKDIDVNQLALSLESDATRTPLDPTMMLEEVGITARTRLRVEVRVGAAVAPTLPSGGPRLRAAGALPYDAALGIPQDVWDGMASSAQTAAQAAGQLRAALAGVPALLHLHPGLPSTAAQQLGIQVIRADAAGNLAVGAFEVPQLRRDITPLPKTFDNMGSAPQQVLLLPQRLKCTFEFVNALTTPNEEFGVLLSGPNGVGKSGIGLLAYLVCMARRLPVAYISRSESWVKVASRKAGGGDEFFLATFWRQNADVIAATPALRTVFAAALRGEGSPFTADVMEALQLAVAAPDGPRVGVIMDEVQHVTQAVAAIDVPNPAPETQWASRYFATSWHDWTNSNAVFTRLSIASAHGQRDMKLPDGESHRLRIIEPLDPEDTAALQEHQSSPAFVCSPPARGEVVFMAGNVLRKLVQGARQLPRDRAPSKAQLQAVSHDLWASMVDDCSKWLKSLAPSHADACAHQVMTLLRGELSWSTAKPLYDAGIVYRTASSALVQPVSAVASAVILHVMAAYVCDQFKDIKSIQDGRRRGFVLEDQVLSFLNPVNKLVPCKLLDGSPGPALQLKCEYSLPFKELEEVVPRDVPVLYRPLSGNYPCDGILMPQAEGEDGSASGEIILVECSTSHPRLHARIDKVQKWYLPAVLPKPARKYDRVATALKARYPLRPLVVALCYDSEVSASPEALSTAGISLSNGMAAPPAVASASGGSGAAGSVPMGTVGSTVRVLDSPSLRGLGLVL